MVLPQNSALISCVPGKAWLPAWLKGSMTIASPVALAGSLSLVRLRLVECDHLLLDLGVHRRRLTWDVVRVVQVPQPHLGRQVLGLRVCEVVALVDFDGHGLTELVALVELLGLAPHPRRLLLSRAGEHAALARS